jgi:hypothetical protein
MSPYLVSPMEFPREEVFDGGSRGQGLAYGFTMEFAQDIAGPLNLGYSCPFGLGLFIPATACWCVL